MAQFRGSARNSGFNAISLPDNARRIESAGIKRIQDLRANYQQTIANQKEDLSDLQGVRNAESQQRAKNERLEDRFQSTYEKALEKRYKQKIQKQKDKADLEKSAYDRLGTFSQEALKVGKDLYENHKDERKEAGMALVFQLGLDAKDLQDLRAKEDDLAAEHGAATAVIQRLKANGASASEIKQIQELDGWALMGAQKEIARNTKVSYYSHMISQETRNKKYETSGGRTLSLAEAEKRGLQSEYKEIRGIISGNFLKPYSGYDLAFAEEYMFPGMRSVNTTLDAQFATAAQKRFEQDENHRLETAALNLLEESKSNSYALANYLQGETGGQGGIILKDARETLVDTISRMVDDGLITNYDQLSSLDSQKITVAGKETTFGDQFLKNGTTAAAFNKIKNVLRDRINADYGRNEREKQRKVEEIEAGLRIEAVNKDLSRAEVEAAQQQIKAMGMPISATIQNLMVNRELPEDGNIQYQLALNELQDGAVFDAAELQAKYPALKATQRKSLVEASGASGSTTNGSGGFRKFTDELEQILKSELKSSNLVDPGAATVGIIRVMKSKFASDVMDLKASKDWKNNTYETIAQEVLRRHKVDIAKQTNGYERKRYKEGKNKDKLITGTDAGFTAVDESVVNQQPKFDTFINQLKDNSRSYLDNKMLGAMDKEGSWARDLPSIKETGQPSQWLQVLSQETKIPWKTLFNSQVRLYFGESSEYELPYNRTEDAFGVISPRFRAVLGTVSSVSSLSVALPAQARGQGAKGTEIYRPLLNLMASHESSNDDVHDGYDALNLGGTHGGSVPIDSNTGEVYFNQSLTTMTLGEIMDRQSRGELFAAGRYQFIPMTLRDMMDRNLIPGNISMDSLFDAQTQDQLAISYIRDTIRAFPTDPTYGIRERWIGVRDNQSYDQTNAIVQRMIADPRIQGTAFANSEIDPAHYARMESRVK